MKLTARLWFVSFLLVTCGGAGCSTDTDGNLVVGGSGFGHADAYDYSSARIKIKDRSEAIRTYLSEKELTPIQGAWVQGDNAYELVIIRNTSEYYKDYDYLGVVIDTREANWSRGQIKLLLRETASSQIYSGMYLGIAHEELGTMFLLSPQNVVEFSVPIGSFGNQHRITLVRTFPKDSQVQHRGETESSSGTGFFVTQDVVATNFHVVKEAKHISLSVGGSSLQAELLLKDVQNDLALLRVNTATLPTTVSALKGIKCLVLGSSDGARSGDAVFTIGFPLSGLLASTPSVAQGLISNMSGIENDPRMFQISIPIQAGNSGSPLLDANGRVIGVVTSTLNSKNMLKTTGTLPQNVNFATKSAYLRSILSMAPSSDCADSTVSRPSPTARDMQDQYAGSVVPITVSR